jgi:indolepyruvate ferredoxin oxidoreductase alpha subunit
VRIGLELSEAFDTPVLLRTTGRVSHAQSLVEVTAEQISRPQPTPPRPFQRNPGKYVMLPVNARQRRLALEERLRRLQEYAETTPLNFIRWGDRRLGIVSSSIAYQYAREVFPLASFLKLGMAHPLPRRLIREFASGVETLLVVEELDPYLEEQIRALPDLPPVRVLGKEVFPAVGEFSPELVARCAADFGFQLSEFGSRVSPPPSPPEELPAPLPGRPPVLCPGCGHRATFYALRQLMFPEQVAGEEDSRLAANPFARATLAHRRQYGLVVTGDIGCYTLGALQPLWAMDTCACMGASIGQAIGLEKAGIKNKVVAVIGDSTFYHSGITGLVDVIVSGAATTVIILDNLTTAMTGGNANPGTGATVDGKPARRVELESLCRGLGIEDVRVLNGYDAEGIRREIAAAVQSPEPSVLIIRQPCVLQARPASPLVAWVQPEKCMACWACLVTACPALIRRDGKAAVIPERCTDCQVCSQVCPHDAILRVEREGVMA